MTHQNCSVQSPRQVLNRDCYGWQAVTKLYVSWMTMNIVRKHSTFMAMFVSTLCRAVICLQTAWLSAATLKGDQTLESHYRVTQWKCLSPPDTDTHGTKAIRNKDKHFLIVYSIFIFIIYFWLVFALVESFLSRANEEQVLIPQ